MMLHILNAKLQLLFPLFSFEESLIAKAMSGK
jgi:hypothetical protein